MEIREIFIWVLLIVPFIISFYQIYILRKIRSGSYGNNQLDDKKYFELKYSIQSYVKTVGMFLAIAAYLGYSSFSKAKNEIEQAYIEQLNKYKVRADSIDAKLNSIEDFIKGFNIEQQAIETALRRAGKDTRGIMENLNSQKTINNIWQSLDSMKKDITNIKANKTQPPISSIGGVKGGTGK